MKSNDCITRVKDLGGNTRTRFIVNGCEYEVTRRRDGSSEILALHRVTTIRGYLPGDNSVSTRTDRISLNSDRAKRVCSKLIEMEFAGLIERLESEPQ